MPRDLETAKAVYRALSHWLERGTFKAGPVTLGSGGLHGIPEGIALVKAGKVRVFVAIVCKFACSSRQRSQHRSWCIESQPSARERRREHDEPDSIHVSAGDFVTLVIRLPVVVCVEHGDGQS